ncbi:MAG: heme-binding beta-barrel domain-containing protein [Gammaproteobacteria bacterium]|nr:heme-binding beta-barrel domain-containing protein [Gammaproteobacteria bacterium]
MAEDDIDYGPLTDLIGVWEGSKGEDIAPEPDGVENNPYYETIIYSAAGDVTNAESQVLAVLHYRQIVKRKSNDKIFHDETGYWMWDAERQLVMHSLNIPRAVSLLAGGSHTGAKNENGETVLEVSASMDDKDWQIIQSPFMRDNAKTQKFQHQITVGNGKMSYFETTIVDIYGKIFEHTDKNQLQLKSI